MVSTGHALAGEEQLVDFNEEWEALEVPDETCARRPREHSEGEGLEPEPEDPERGITQ